MAVCVCVVYSDQYTRTDIKNAFTSPNILYFPCKCIAVVAGFFVLFFEGDGNWSKKSLCWNGLFVDYIFPNTVDIMCQICDHKYHSLPDALIR